MAAAAPKGGGITRSSPVDADKLWRDRVNMELQQQRGWIEEYGFMIDDDKKRTLEKGISAGETAGARPRWDDFKSQMTYKGMRSTMGDSYRVRPTPEIFSAHEHGRKKFVFN